MDKKFILAIFHNWIHTFQLLQAWIIKQEFGVNYIKLDIRNTSKKLFNLEGHQDDVVKVEWSPFQMSTLASCGVDRRVIVWDLSKEP